MSRQYYKGKENELTVLIKAKDLIYQNVFKEDGENGTINNKP
jgi:hypothetical protein